MLDPTEAVIQRYVRVRLAFAAGYYLQARSLSNSPRNSFSASGATPILAALAVFLDADQNPLDCTAAGSTLADFELAR